MINIKKIFIPFLTVLLLTACSSQVPDASTSSPGPEYGTALDLPIKTAINEIPLINDSGEALNLNYFKGKTLVITPIFTACDDICPLSAASFGAAQDAIVDKDLTSDISLLLVSIDPKRDTPERLKAFREKIGLNENVSLLTGTEQDMNKFWDGFGIAREITEAENHAGHLDWFTGQPMTYEIVHSDGLFFISKDQKLKFLRLGTPDVSRIIVNEGTKDLLNPEVVDKLATPVAGGWSASDLVRILSWLEKKSITLL